MELFHQLIYEQFALYEPCSISRNIADKITITLQTDLYMAGLSLIGCKLRDLIG